MANAPKDVVLSIERIASIVINIIHVLRFTILIKRNSIMKNNAVNIWHKSCLLKTRRKDIF